MKTLIAVVISILTTQPVFAADVSVVVNGETYTCSRGGSVRRCVCRDVGYGSNYKIGLFESTEPSDSLRYLWATYDYYYPGDNTSRTRLITECMEKMKTSYAAICE
jgi:hypothetical protein